MPQLLDGFSPPLVLIPPRGRNVGLERQSSSVWLRAAHLFRCVRALPFSWDWSQRPLMSSRAGARLRPFPASPTVQPSAPMGPAVHTWPQEWRRSHSIAGAQISKESIQLGNIVPWLASLRGVDS
jgi:hypothetical protein